MKQSVAAALVALFLCQSVALVAQQAADQFQKVKLMVNTGDKPDAADAIIRLESDRLIVRAHPGGADLKVFPYTAIKNAEYSYSKSPRWKSGTAVAVAVGVFAIPIFFMKGKRHWLTVTTDKDFAVMQLDKVNYKMILPALEARSGVKVVTVADEK